MFGTPDEPLSTSKLAKRHDARWVMFGATVGIVIRRRTTPFPLQVARETLLGPRHLQRLGRQQPMRARERPQRVRQMPPGRPRPRPLKEHAMKSSGPARSPRRPHVQERARTKARCRMDHVWSNLNDRHQVTTLMPFPLPVSEENPWQPWRWQHWRRT